jgi:hypothetical protein
LMPEEADRSVEGDRVRMRGVSGTVVGQQIVYPFSGMVGKRPKSTRSMTCGRSGKRGSRNDSGHVSQPRLALALARPRLRRGWGLPRGPSSGQLLATAKIGAFAMGTMSNEEPVCEIHKDDNDDVFILIDGTKIAKRGLPDTAHAMTWIMLEPGWIVRDVDHGNAIEVRFEGARIH